MATVRTTVQWHSTSEGRVFPTGWYCCAKAAQDAHLYPCQDLLGRMREPWTETTAQMEACSCTACSVSCQSILSSVQGWRSHSFPLPCLSSHPRSLAFTSFLSQRWRGSFDLSYCTRRMCCNFYLPSPLQNMEKGALLLHAPSRGVLRKHNPSHRNVHSSHFLWQIKSTMYFSWFPKVSK